MARSIYTWLAILFVASVLLATIFNDRVDPYMMQVIAVYLFSIGFTCALGSFLLKGLCYWWVSDRLLRFHARLGRVGNVVMLSALVFMLPFVRSIRDLILVGGALIIGALWRGQTA